MMNNKGGHPGSNNKYHHKASAAAVDPVTSSGVQTSLDCIPHTIIVKRAVMEQTSPINQVTQTVSYEFVGVVHAVPGLF
jgi:hypothetical protein